ncbi:Polyketide cyclase / dehydrase and lipid transport [Pseudonocardia thermophila]|jgi:Polyketide cyclase / dehydrase and lipid transport.|uniref:Polyketide cyclase / dehydrase and lipid transport n=1 Tax=Pseudonocardia thermophila TaxID=1848 RepID=A0A1M6PAC5_PSETH|nr:SRPBCC family protein [Pseudonocardia thermophila]SHK04909.1 Polyketide cyclase / dehydrase and lipid transport [Pseudonocardia thermophila]
MAQVTAQASRTIAAPADTVYAALADYATTRPKILTDSYRDYRVEAGGQGTGTRAAWKLQATRSRVRDQVVDVTEPAPRRLVEADANSSMVTVWTVRPEGPDRSTVTVDTRWNGAGGIGGFFERLFAPSGLARIHDGVLEKLDAVVTR